MTVHQRDRHIFSLWQAHPGDPEESSSLFLLCFLPRGWWEGWAGGSTCVRGSDLEWQGGLSRREQLGKEAFSTGP